LFIAHATTLPESGGKRNGGELGNWPFIDFTVPQRRFALR
jgi:hypothetical protein